MIAGISLPPLYNNPVIYAGRQKTSLSFRKSLVYSRYLFSQQQRIVWRESENCDLAAGQPLPQDFRLGQEAERSAVGVERLAKIVINWQAENGGGDVFRLLQAGAARCQRHGRA